MRGLPGATTSRRHAVAALLAAGGLLLGGVACESEGGSGPGLGDEIGGQRIGGSGYSIEAPDGWHDANAAAAQLGPGEVDLAIAAEPSGEFATNLNVVRVTPQPTAKLDQLARLLTDEVTPLADGPVKPIERIEIDGSPAVGHELESDAGGVLHYLRQYATLHDNALYTVTMSAAPDEADAAVDAMDEILASWTWETPTA